MRKPDFFIVGAPKCGTTAMNRYLGQHPEVFMPEIKEIHYFGSDLRVHNDMSLKSYLSIFKNAGEARRVGETSVWHLYSKVAAREIKEFEPEARIIIMLRNPVDKIHSSHSYALYHGSETIPDFRAALEAEKYRREDPATPIGVLYKEAMDYTEQVQRYVDAFGWQKVHVIIHDDLRNDPVGTYQKALEFLDVDPGFVPSFNVVNPNKRSRSRKVQSLLSRPPQALRVAGRSVLPRQLRYGVMQKLKKFNSRDEPRSSMDPELRKSLQKEFAPEVERLSRLLERDLTHWNAGG